MYKVKVGFIWKILKTRFSLKNHRMHSKIFKKARLLRNLFKNVKTPKKGRKNNFFLKKNGFFPNFF